ncbi:MAG: flippase-like domain-containing protein [Ignavibacteriae bacterium]|nr:flippase-like domain-containing protein [Ignavibacteriota bacterium]
MKNKFLSNFIKITFTVALAIYAFYKSGLFDADGQEKFLGLLSNVRVGYLIFSILLAFFLNLSSAIKWNMLLNSRGVFVKLWRIYAFYSIGKFFNLILPTSLGGDVVRIYQLGQYTGKKHTAAASVIVERFSGLIVLMIMAVIAVIININVFNQLWLSIALLSGSIFLGIIVWIIFSQSVFDFFYNIIGRKIKIVGKIFNKIQKIRQMIIEFKSDKKAMVWALINSLIFQLLAVVNVWISAKAFNDELSFITSLIAVPVILFIMNIPFSIGGIGLMEFGYVFTLPLFGISTALSISTALLIRFKSILDALIGGIFYLFLKNNKSIVDEISKEQIT